MEAAAPCAIAEALQAQAVQTPDSAAVWDRRRSLTYAELDDAVGRLAARLATRRDSLGECGVLPVIAGRDVGSVVAIHAALRAGIALAPLDATLPAGAIASVLRRIDDPRVAIVSDPRHASVLPAEVSSLPAFASSGDSLLPVPVTDGPARIVFTSGSTGVPKGVVMSWATINRYASDPILRLLPSPQDFRALAVSPFGFAAGFVAALRVALGAPASVVDPNAHDAVELLELCDRERLTVMTVVPSLLASVLDRWPDGRRLETIRIVRTIGEPLEWATVGLLRRFLPPDAVVLNNYGSSELGGVAVDLVIDSTMPLGTGRVPLGRPSHDGEVRLDPVFGDDPEAPREIIVRGTGVALGYWRDPELTASAFGRESDGTPFWRSGDLVREDADGLLHYVGRRDSVVKINGKLVEPSEPEKALGTVAGVRRAVVLVQPAPRGGQRLVAHVELADDPPTPSAVRAAVAAQVAPHLVPAILVRHDRLPLTSRGKIDRQALMTAAPEPWIDHRSARTAVAFEVAVLGVAAEILGHDRVGPDDDLWDAGLDSLGAAELLAALEDFGWPPLPESVLLEHRSVSALDRLRSTFLPSGDDIWLNEDGDDDVVVCVLPPASDALTYRRLAQELSPDHPVVIVRQFDPFAVHADVVTVDQIAQSLADRLLARLRGRPTVVIGYSASGVVAHELERRLRGAGTATRLVLLDTGAGGSASGPAAGAPRTVRRRMRAAARQAWLRSLPASTMPQRERAFARYEVAQRAAQEHVPRSGDTTAALFQTRDGASGSIARTWSTIVPDLTVVHLDCDHFEILGDPYIGEVVRWVRGSPASTEP